VVASFVGLVCRGGAGGASRAHVHPCRVRREVGVFRGCRCAPPPAHYDEPCGLGERAFALRRMSAEVRCPQCQKYERQIGVPDGERRLRAIECSSSR
jgi:hypothetical protein